MGISRKKSSFIWHYMEQLHSIYSRDQLLASYGRINLLCRIVQQRNKSKLALLL